MKHILCLSGGASHSKVDSDVIRNILSSLLSQYATPMRLNYSVLRTSIHAVVRENDLDAVLTSVEYIVDNSNNIIIII